MNKTKNSLKITVALAMLAAISIVCGKYLAIRGGDVMRFSLENTPIILAGMAFGPLAGVAVGVVADLVGCLMVAYTVNPIVTLGAAAIGALSGVVPYLLKKLKLPELAVTVITVAAAHLIGSVLIKTAGLAAYYDMPYGILLLWRLLNYAIVGALDGAIVHLLLKNRGIRILLDRLRGDKNDL